MSMAPLEPTGDDPIQDFLDGRLDREARQAVIAGLRAQPEEALRVVELIAGDATLRRLGHATLTDDVPERLTAMVAAARRTAQGRPTAKPAARRTGRMPALARPLAACVLLALGLGLGWIGSDRLVPRLNDADLAYSDAMTAFSFYVETPDAPIQYSHEQLDVFLPKVREALGRDLAPPDLLGQGFEFLAARLLPNAGGQAVFYLYQNASDPADRIGIYVWRMRSDGRPTAPLPRQSEQFVSRSWDDGGLGYTLLATPAERDFDLLQGDIRKHFDPIPSGS